MKSRSHHSSQLAFILSVLVGLTLPLAADLVSYWNLDETEGVTAADSAGDNVATFQDPDVGLEWVEGRVGNAAKLTDSGGENYFLIESINGLIGAEGITISAWVDVEPQNPNYNGIFMTRTINDAENNSWGIAVQNGKLDSRTNGPGNNSPQALGVDDGWIHILMVWDGVEGANRNYINGILAGENLNGILIGAIQATSGPWYIGYDDCCGGGRDFDGAIDELAVWNEVLDEGKIALLATGVKPDQLNAIDLDNDGISNDIEEMFDFLDPNNAADAAMDEDGDGLTNVKEVLQGTKLDVADTDGDSLSDGDEVNKIGSDPLLVDTDGDTLPDGDEVNTHKTDPRFADSDGDRIADGQELIDETDPLDPLSPTPDEPGLVGLWRLDDGAGSIAKDSVSGNDGVWKAPEEGGLEWVPEGLIGGAVNASDQGGDVNYFEIESIPQLLGAKGVTISVWISPADQTNSAYNGIFMARQFNLGEGQAANSWGLATRDGGTLDARVNGAGLTSDPDAAIPEEGVWHHVALVWNGEEGTHELYVDGAQAAINEGASTEPIVGPASGPWHIGYDNCCGGRAFDGLLDDIAVWNKALSAIEIADVFQAGIGGIGVTPNAGFSITDISRTDADNVTLTWTSQAGQFFRIRSSATLKDDAWTTVQSDIAAAADGSTTSATVAITDGTAFYRVERSAAPAYLSEDFEGEVKGWTSLSNGLAVSTSWELGTPTVVGPPAANSGTNVYGTDLDAPYEDLILGEGNKGIALRSPIIDLAGDTFVTLEFSYYLDLAGDDAGGGRVNILDENGDFLASVDPLLINASVDGGEAEARQWTRNGPTRLPQVVTDAGKIIVEFEFLSAESAEPNGGGLYIDDVIVQ